MAEHDEFIEQVMPNYQRLVRALTLTCGDREEAEDAVQEAVARAWSRTRKGEPPRSLEGWIAVVAMNEVRTGGRRRASRDRALQRMQGHANIDAVVPASAEQAADAVAVLAALRDLAPRQREVTVMHYYLGYDIAEAATLLGITAGAARNALHNARAHLAVAFGAEGDEDRVLPLATSEETRRG
jgi:RNA polymerase sigma-70 factor (ECF subfamily)